MPMGAYEVVGLEPEAREAGQRAPQDTEAAVHPKAYHVRHKRFVLSIAAVLVCTTLGLAMTNKVANSGLSNSRHQRRWTGLVETHESGDGGWKHEHIGFFKNSLTGLCVDLDGNPDRDGAQAMVAGCKFNESSSGQMWAVDIQTGFIRSVVSNGRCLNVEGHPGWKNGALVTARKCNYSAVAAGSDAATDQCWKFDRAGFIVNRLSGKCIDVGGDSESQLLQIWHCQFGKDGTDQTWRFIGEAEAAGMTGHAEGRLDDALEDEAKRRFNAASVSDLLTLEDVTRAEDPSVLLNGSFWTTMPVLFGKLAPGWDKWSNLFKVFQQLAVAGSAQTALGTHFLLSYLSNMAFAGMNFVQGFEGEDLTIGGSTLNIEEFVGNQTLRCRERVLEHWGEKWMSVCRWRRPVDGEYTDVTTVDKQVDHDYGISLPANTFFSHLTTGARSPSWEDGDGIAASFRLAEAGFEAARSLGVEPMSLARSIPTARFAFDTEGLEALLDVGFGWFKTREAKYASPGLQGGAGLEKPDANNKTDKDVLGLLMTDSVLSMHLRRVNTFFEVDLSAFEEYQPIPGYAKLGGRALFKEDGERLRTVQLQYMGKTFNEFNDAQSDADFKNSRLSGWRFAQAAIIASLMAKTQLLVHVKTIHMEMAPAIHAVTVDAFAKFPDHPVRRLLEPFLSRSIQASQTNLRLWFQFRAGEFGLAPLPVEEQLRLIHESVRLEPLNLASLDMERFAAVRGMEKYTGDFATAGNWHWRWHYRALKVQRLLEKLITCWVNKSYGGEHARIYTDEALQNWWKKLLDDVPALRLAAEQDSDWVVPTKRPAAPPPAIVKPTSPPMPPQAPEAPPSVAEQATPQATPTEKPDFVNVLSLGQPKTPQESSVNMIGARRLGELGFDENGNFGELDDKDHLIHPKTKSGGSQKDKPTKPPTRPPPTAPATTKEPWWRKTMTSRAPPHVAVIPTPPQIHAGELPPLPVPQSGTSELNAETLRNLLRTIMVWASWVHEDVGHAAASLIYDPVNTPMFVPEDGMGIPMVPLAAMTAAYRSFIFVERAKLLDTPPPFWFDHKWCKKYLLVFTSCTRNNGDKACFTEFQDELEALSSDPSFANCKDGLYPCLDRVETSASS